MFDDITQAIKALDKFYVTLYQQDGDAIHCTVGSKNWPNRDRALGRAKSVGLALLNAVRAVCYHCADKLSEEEHEQLLQWTTEYGEKILEEC